MILRLVLEEVFVGVRMSCHQHIVDNKGEVELSQFVLGGQR